MAKQFMTTPASAGYGSRIWIETAEFGDDLYKGSPLYNLLRPLCMWGGHDKSGDNFIAFEFSSYEPEKHEQAVKVLESVGYSNQKFRLVS